MSLSNQWCYKAPADTEASVNNVFDPRAVDLLLLGLFVQYWSGFSLYCLSLLSCLAVIILLTAVVVYNQ